MCGYEVGKVQSILPHSTLSVTKMGTRSYNSSPRTISWCPCPAAKCSTPPGAPSLLPLTLYSPCAETLWWRGGGRWQQRMSGEEEEGGMTGDRAAQCAKMKRAL